MSSTPSLHCTYDSALDRYTGDTGDHADFDWRKPTFALATPPADRKRAHGTPATVKDHHQDRLQTGERCRLPNEEVCGATFDHVGAPPGEAIAFALDVIHPFTKDTELDADLVRAYEASVAHPITVSERRRDLLRHWNHRAHELLAAADRELKAIIDGAFQRLLRGAEAQCPDTELVSQIVAGTPIVSDIAPSQRWAPDRRPRILDAGTTSIESLGLPREGLEGGSLGSYCSTFRKGVGSYYGGCHDQPLL